METKWMLSSIRKKSWGVRVAGFINGMALVLAAFAAGGAVSERAGMPPLVAFYVAIVMMYVGFFLLVAVHEFGHALVAAMFHWQLSMIAIGPISIKFQPLRVFVGTPVRGSFLAGAVWAFPKRDAGSRNSWIAMTAGGPLTNIFIGVVAGCFALLIWPSVLAVCIASLGALSLALGLTTLLPYNATAGGRSDGALIWGLLHGEDTAPRATVLKVFHDSINGVRPRTWSAALVGELEANARKPGVRNELAMLYSFHFDCDEFLEARTALRQAIKKMGPLDTLLIEDALLAGYAESDFSRADTVLALVRSKRSRRMFKYHLVKAMLSLRGKDKNEAARQIWFARRSLKKWSLATSQDWELLDQIDRSVCNSAIGVEPALSDEPALIAN